MRILSGIQPSGGLHIGNYFGMMKRMIAYQNNSELFCFIVNFHALTSVFDGPALSKNTIAAAADFLALGIDPEKSFFWVQSDVPEVLELTWYLSNITPVGLLERCHSYKDKIAKGISASHGLFSYPVLMAADILLYHGEKIPVGKDQKQHVEVARDIAIKFNSVYGEVLTIPEPVIEDQCGLIPGTDGQKMSKSYGNTIGIFEDEKVIKKQVMSIVTDSTPLEEPKNPDTCTVVRLYALFASDAEVSAMKEKYRVGGFGYGSAKKVLYERIMDYFAPFRVRRNELIKNPALITDVLNTGAVKVRREALKTMEIVRKKVGIVYGAQ